MHDIKTKILLVGKDMYDHMFRDVIVKFCIIIEENNTKPVWVFCSSIFQIDYKWSSPKHCKLPFIDNILW